MGTPKKVSCAEGGTGNVRSETGGSRSPSDLQTVTLLLVELAQVGFRFVMKT